jgi:ribonuclease PH
MQDPKTAILRVNYDMLSFSVSDRKKPGPNRRSQEISKVTEWALSPALELKEFPNTVIDVQIYILQADASTRVAGINAASMALAQAGIPMKDLVCAVSIGKMDKDIEPSSQQLKLGATEWYNEFDKDGRQLTVTYDPKTRATKDFFIRNISKIKSPSDIRTIPFIFNSKINNTKTFIHFTPRFVMGNSSVFPRSNNRLK